MNNIDGVVIPTQYLPDFIWVEDIQYYEGTLTAEYKTEKGETYIFQWCDCNETTNRWLVVRTDKRALYELTSGISTLSNFFSEGILDTNIYILDVDADETIQRSMLIQYQNIPNDYLPEPDTYILPDLMPDKSSNRYPILIDGNWSQHDLSDFPRKFMDSYAFIDRYITRNSTYNDNSLTNFPWAGGYSSTNFYSKLRDGLRNILSMNAIRYASPGYFQFSANRDTALLVKKNVDAYIANEDRIDTVFKDISNYLKDNELNNDRSTLNNNQETWLNNKGLSLMEDFSEPRWDWILESTPDTFRAIKVSMSYYRRIRPLALYVKTNKAVFGKF